MSKKIKESDMYLTVELSNNDTIDTCAATFIDGDSALRFLHTLQWSGRTWRLAGALESFVGYWSDDRSEGIHW